MQSPLRRLLAVAGGALALAIAGVQVTGAAAGQHPNASKDQAQTTPPPLVNSPSPTAGPVPTTCNGPTVNADRTVTFCLTAPDATNVQLSFQNMLGLSPAADAHPMDKTASGIWYITMGPLEPNYYGYAFIVGGARVADPKNRNIWSLDTAAWSNVLVSGPGTEFMEQASVPHGAVSTVYYPSRVTQTERRMLVYTPPGYNRDRRGYPVFYLLHGGGGNDTDWVANMRANFILDNLIAQHRMKPMIVAMPDMNVGGTEQLCQRSIECGGPHELIDSVIPYIEENYRAERGPRNRALAGLSVGGDVVRNVLLHYPNAFSYAGFFSGGQMPPEVVTDVTQNHSDLLRGWASSKTLDLLWISFGGEEALVSNHQHWEAATEALFDQYHIDYTYVDGPTFGAVYGHVWDTWRKDLREFAPLLFTRRGHDGHDRSR